MSQQQQLSENQIKQEEKNVEQGSGGQFTANDASFNVLHKPHELDKSDKNKNDKSWKETIQENVSGALNDASNWLTMEYLLKQAYTSFGEFINPKFEKDQQCIPSQILNEAKGIMFLSIYKGGVGIGGQFGTGIIIARDPSWRTNWSGPCAIGVGGVQIGFNIGIEKTDHIIIIRDSDVINKFHSGIRLGGDISLAVGPLGRDTNIGISVNEKGILPNISYSISKGAYFGVSLEGCIITIRNDCNQKYYGQDINVLQILNGSVTAPFNSDYSTLCQSLDKHIKCAECKNLNNTSSSSTTTTNVTLPNENPILNVPSNVLKE